MATAHIVNSPFSDKSDLHAMDAETRGDQLGRSTSNDIPSDASSACLHHCSTHSSGRARVLPWFPRNSVGELLCSKIVSIGSIPFGSCSE